MISAEQIQNDASERSSGILSGDWELDFYSRPILEPDGKKRWELLIISSPCEGTTASFRFEKRCPAGSVNSTWLTSALTGSHCGCPTARLGRSSKAAFLEKLHAHHGSESCL
jgi:hypothetical protein